MNEFLTWQMLATLGGASLATGLITHFLKNLIPMKTQLLSYLTAFTVLTAALFFTGSRNPGDYALALINAVIVAGTASNTVALAQRLSKPEEM